MYLYIEKTKYGYRITTYTNIFADRCEYIGYTQKQAIKKHREKYGLKYKRLKIVEMN